MAMVDSQTPTKRVTAADVARALGLSRATVGFVLNNTPGQTISAQTRERVLAEAARLGYRPHTAARALASGRTRIVLVVLPDWPLDFSVRRNLEEASLALDEAGYSLITYTPHPTGQSRPLWEVLEPDVVLSFTGSFTDAQVASIRAAGVRAMLPDPDAPAVAPYPEEGPLLQVGHLHALGHRRIAYAGSSDPRIADLVELRRSRAREAAARLGLDLAPGHDLLPGDDAADAVAGWRAAGVTAVAAYNDDIAATLVGTATRMGLLVPRDLSVVGHDDAPIASIVEPRLSTVRLDTADLGRYLARLALTAAEGREPPRQPTAASPLLVQRASTAAPGA